MSTIADLPPSAKLLIGQSAQTNFAMDGSGLKMRLTWSVSWEDSPAFLEALQGYPETIGTLTRRVPLRNQFVPSIYALAISNARFVGADSAISASRISTHIHYTIEYGPLGYEVGGDSAYVTINHAGSTRSVTVPGVQYAFSAGTYSGTKVQQDVAQPIGGVGMQLTLHQVPSISAFVATADAMLGTVNSTSLVVAGITRAAGTVYFDTYESQSTRSVLGTEQHEVSISLIYSALPWNKFLDPGGSANAVTPAPFPTANHNTLLM